MGHGLLKYIQCLYKTLEEKCLFDTSFFFSEEKTSESLTGIEPMTF